MFQASVELCKMVLIWMKSFCAVIHINGGQPDVLQTVEVICLCSVFHMTHSLLILGLNLVHGNV